MKRLLVMILCMVLLTGCGNRDRADSQNSEKDMFVYINPQSYNNYHIVYHKDTKVMYAVSAGPYNCGNFTLLVNPDGSPMLYEAESEEE